MNYELSTGRSPQPLAQAALCGQGRKEGREDSDDDVTNSLKYLSLMLGHKY